LAIGADLDLQRAIVTKLKTSSALQALIGATIRLHQDVPENPTFPYVTIGPSQRLPDLAECINGAEIFADIHVFARSNGWAGCKQIGATLIAELHNADDLDLRENILVLIEIADERYFIEPDNLTKHGVVTFRALVEPIVP
jgi:hypothetical protein